MGGGGNQDWGAEGPPKSIKIDTPDCKPHITPVGHTTTTLSRRLTYHMQNGDLEKHMREKYNRFCFWIKALSVQSDHCRAMGYRIGG